MLPYGRQSVTDDDVDAVVAALRSDWLTTGPQVEAFEADLATWTGGVDCAVVSNGTAALHVAYAAAGIRPGDEVIVPPMTFVATASSAVALGARIVFADVEEETFTLDPAAVAAATTSRTRVVAAVDYAGHPADYDALRGAMGGSGALLLADAAHSIGATYRGRPVGSLADLTTFSFFPTKNLTTAEGGAVAALDRDLLKRARRFRNIGLVRDRDEQRWPDEGGWHQEVHEFGLNYRLPDVLCALGRSQLRRLDAFLARRAELVARYDEALADLPGVLTPGRRSWARPAWHLYPVRILDGRRREVYDRMRAAGIGVQVNYIPVHWHPAFADLGYRRGSCPVAESFYAQQLSLPLYPTLRDADQERVVDALAAALRAATARHAA
ncbi:DegT/DnrJ/EryC1/StrS family aminotransferase [Micromonospora globbae]|jgi:perosamine synthetase|uniref:Aminotransferase class I/II-fold pyridoxal phosphate-dependent enzyme n=1 Tax=Micromonospora globbae TaxID=1894969 RepID=A0A420F261_9ACTN|nr:aminotransferase class I/II-fold pyridoxal phosphate-dependent enzyme [Micromonospora globbae]RKF27018.1 aminotransferase class I/II-fold pyridoxal phosphate-dependent enzyme [Micromonospora globbae]